MTQQLKNEIRQFHPHAGARVHHGDAGQSGHIQSAVYRVPKETGIAINFVTCSYGVFPRYWQAGESEPGDEHLIEGTERERIRVMNCHACHRPTAYFTSNLVDVICNGDRNETDYAWFANLRGRDRTCLTNEDWENLEAQFSLQ